ncbi:hypothetical protein BDA96_08G116500 [Sorghum bicolor]|uniref:Uncharacterized protein n=2 Tax=Sorghum bicolor TaxID=4558 RepID=A0A921QFI5_SORBI|nr:hypothetical protein BDA96_08G116500 [Sorghum bicolor]KXG23509.1 hypothetical protein SORBI_3008G104900 [Sorghum bicolor]
MVPPASFVASSSLGPPRHCLRAPLGVVTKRRQILTVRLRILVPPVVAASSPWLPLDRGPMHPGDAPAVVATALFASSCGALVWRSLDVPHAWEVEHSAQSGHSFYWISRM